LKDSQVRLRANVVTLAGALYDLPGLAYELQKAGASEIKFSMMLPHGPARESMANLLTIRENNILKQSLLARDDLYIPIQFQSFDRYSFMCHIPEKQRLFFAADGRIYPCSAFLNSDHEIGRVTGKQSVSKSFERIAWCKVLNLVKQIEENKCPALELGLYVDCQDMIVHQGCPPFAERLVEKR
jgi:radical SAM protein with 4Fe4S-binding SPASM domain